VSDGAPIHLVTALRAEARPLIEAFALRSAGARGRFSGSHHSGVPLELLVSGVGHEAAASAPRRLPGTARAWINTGIAGHPSLPRGTTVVATAVTDETSGRRWPLWPAVWSPPTGCAALELLTVRRPVDLACDAAVATPAVEMEAAALAAALDRCHPPPRLLCLKVISDNASTGRDALDARTVARLMRRAIPALHALLARLAGCG